MSNASQQGSKTSFVKNVFTSWSVIVLLWNWKLDFHLRMLWLLPVGTSNWDQREKLTVTFSISIQFTLQIICLFFLIVHDNKSQCNGLLSVNSSRNSCALDFFFPDPGIKWKGAVNVVITLGLPFLSCWSNPNFLKTKWTNNKNNPNQNNNSNK